MNSIIFILEKKCFIIFDTKFGNSGYSAAAARKWPIYFVTSFSRKVVSWGESIFFSRLKTSPDLIWKLFIPQRKHLGGFKLTIKYSGAPLIFVAQFQIPIPNEYLWCAYKDIVFFRNDSWIMETWTRDSLYRNWCW